ncbi:Short chain dehydrogenase citE [Colletotrichum trifolii]|uniref:Short chain dehydrogenase citE n=1 Tax=Colletotrichum trifolii TaxID=5466 RepID=A0A4R8RF38_COLTR|nr:Short chain dehydrogenase citE [Colletotrichum trifolii]
MEQRKPRLHNEVYPFIYPSKFKGSLKGEVAVVTGSTGTIGRAIAECFSTAGASLVLTYNRTPPSEAFRQTCLQLGAGAVTFIQCNVSNLESCRNLIEQTEQQFEKVDILINNAGVEGVGPMHTQDPRKLADDIAANLHGPMYLMRLAMPSFIKTGRGCVLNIASRGGTVDMPFNSTYSTGKAALIRLTSAWQAELDIMGHRDVHLYAVHPGAVVSGLASADALSEKLGAYPGVVEKFADMLRNFKDSPHLCGMALVALANGVAKGVLRGRYVDVQQDLEDVLSQAAALEENPDLYKLHTSFLGGLANDGGTENAAAEKAFDFPGHAS